MQLKEELVNKIATIDIFKGMTRQCLINTLNCADSWPVKEGESFFREGEKGESFFVLLSGQVDVVKNLKGTAVTLATLKPGSCFGEMALVDGGGRSATVQATANTISLRFSRSKLEGYPEAAAFIYKNIAKILVKRLAESNQKVAEHAAEHQ